MPTCRFWGVFWIDATSVETAKQSFAKIGKIGGMEATQSAGKHWLSNLDEPWLLIINNADDPSLNLSDLFPEGDRGHILVSTRNPDFRVHATVGSTEFKGLKEKEALTLLLRAAGVPLPCDSATESSGNQITSALGYLALALVQAGALILQRICEIKNYLEFYDQHRNELSLHPPLREKDQFTVYATWELSLNSLQLRHTEASMDAAQILSIVAFFHFEHIRVDIFTRALANRLDAADNQLSQSFLARVWHGIRTRLHPRLVLPECLRQESSKLGVFRIRRALHELYSFSLISYDGRDDSFSLHPVVHAWARDRLDKGGQSLWAHIALNVLTESVLLPPQDAGVAHEEFRRDILPHLDLCLRASPIQILDYEAYFGGFRFPFALILQHTWLLVFREQVLKAAKCGYVYAERGRFKEAAELLSRVKDALIKSRGYQNEATMRAMLALAATYWGLGRLKEAVTLQSIVVEARKKSYGLDHAETLSAMDQLGRSYWLNGQYKDALELQTLTVERMSATLGPTCDETLTAMDNLGVTYGSWQMHKESRDVHRIVLAAREKKLGLSHLDTLTTMNNLAMALKDLGNLDEAEKLMTTVYDERKLKLGKEHPWTLWALCNLAKVHTELKHFDIAEGMLIPGIAAAKRSLGDDHLGVLMGEGELARVLARQGRLEEAERLTRDLIKHLERSRGLSHPDTIYSLSKMAQLYEQMNKVDQAIEMCQIAAERIDDKLTMQHPLAQKVCLRLERLRARQKTGSKDQGAPQQMPSEEVESVDKQISTHPSKHSFIANTKKLRKHETF
jgi:tetratricopeptide (TPR) repeat protein